MWFLRSRAIEKIRAEIEMDNNLAELRFMIENPPKYIEGEILADGTVITSVTKIHMPRSRYSSIAGEDLGTCFSGWIWAYKGVKDGKIINVN